MYLFVTGLGSLCYTVSSPVWSLPQSIFNLSCTWHIMYSICPIFVTQYLQPVPRIPLWHSIFILSYICDTVSSTCPTPFTQYILPVIYLSQYPQAALRMSHRIFSLSHFCHTVSSTCPKSVCSSGWLWGNELNSMILSAGFSKDSSDSRVSESDSEEQVGSRADWGSTKRTWK